MDSLRCTRTTGGLHILAYLMPKLSALDVAFLLITKEMLINGRGIFELREYTHLTLKN